MYNDVSKTAALVPQKGGEGSEQAMITLQGIAEHRFSNVKLKKIMSPDVL